MGRRQVAVPYPSAWILCAECVVGAWSSCMVYGPDVGDGGVGSCDRHPTTNGSAGGSCSGCGRALRALRACTATLRMRILYASPVPLQCRDHSVDQLRLGRGGESVRGSKRSRGAVSSVSQSVDEDGTGVSVWLWWWWWCCFLESRCI
jgi:hypothetical protein